MWMFCIHGGEDNSNSEHTVLNKCVSVNTDTDPTSVFGL